VAAGYAQLRLARTIVTDLRLPWEQPLAPDQLTPNGSAADFVLSWRSWGLLPARRNPTAGPQAVPEAPYAAPRRAIQPSSSLPDQPPDQTTRLKAKLSRLALSNDSAEAAQLT
jgi:hypothetical protein